MSKKGKRIVFALELTGLAGLGALIGVANFFYKFSLTPKKHDPRHDIKDCEKDYVAGRRWMNEHVMRKDLFLQSEDHKQLHANYIPSPNPDCHRYAVCVHGYADSAESMGLYARHYYEDHGMNVLLPDLRGHGASEGNYVGMGYDDHFDILMWIRHIISEDPKAIIILHGISMGAATVLMTTGETLPPEVKAAVADASYTSAMEVFSSVYEGLPGAIIPAPVMLQLVRFVAMIRAHYDIEKASPLSSVTRSSTPTLFIHGDADDFVPSSMMPRLFEAASCPKEFLWISGASHVQSVVVNPKKYWTTVDAFLEKISPFILNDNVSANDGEDE